MKIFFRPLAGFTLFAVPLLALLAGLGVWQLDRLQWKLQLIAAMNRNMHAAPISIDRALAMDLSKAQYRRVLLTGRFINARESYVFTTDEQGAPVYHVLTPLLSGNGREIMVDRGLVPPFLRDPSSRRQGELVGELHIVGILRTPDAPGPFTPQPDPAGNIWFARDLKGIAAARHIRLSAPVIVEADAHANPGGWPRGGQTRVNLPNDHLQYAITWFLLAAALVFVYVAYHHTRGRLTIRFS
ncbi:MAG TPA: SURF1 family protein [Rhizomicrobium sp.]